LETFVPIKWRIAWRHRRGVLRAKRGQHAAALEDYREVIEYDQVDDSMLAMTLYNRALVYDLLGKRAEAIEDLERLQQLSRAPERVKTEARRRLLRMDQRLARSDTRNP
jgi:tetratricopeptide (TPR) repeat protein